MATVRLGEPSYLHAWGMVRFHEDTKQVINTTSTNAGVIVMEAIVFATVAILALLSMWYMHRRDMKAEGVPEVQYVKRVGFDDAFLYMLEADTEELEILTFAAALRALEIESDRQEYRQRSSMGTLILG